MFWVFFMIVFLITAKKHGFDTNFWEISKTIGYVSSLKLVTIFESVEFTSFFGFSAITVGNIVSVQLFLKVSAEKVILSFHCFPCFFLLEGFNSNFVGSFGKKMETRLNNCKSKIIQWIFLIHQKNSFEIQQIIDSGSKNIKSKAFENDLH